jgi:hypothetical protein
LQTSVARRPSFVACASSNCVSTIDTKHIADRFTDPSVCKTIEIDLALIDRCDELLGDVELYLTRTAKVDDPQAYYRLQTIAGVGKILALVLLYEIHDIRRFADVVDTTLRLWDVALLGDREGFDKIFAAMARSPSITFDPRPEVAASPPDTAAKTNSQYSDTTRDVLIHTFLLVPDPPTDPEHSVVA